MIIIRNNFVGFLLLLLLLLLSVPPSVESYHIRQATRADLKAIQKCNRLHFPEGAFPHMSVQLINYPKLCIIAEKLEREEGGDEGGDNLVGYVLGQADYKGHTRHYDCDTNGNLVGHVTSLAVYDGYRGQGVGETLMKTIHQAFVHSYNIDTSTLYVRSLNDGANHLYSETLSYNVYKVVEEFYHEPMDSANLMHLHGLMKQV